MYVYMYDHQSRCRGVMSCLRLVLCTCTRERALSTFWRVLAHAKVIINNLNEPRAVFLVYRPPKKTPWKLTSFQNSKRKNQKWIFSEFSTFRSTHNEKSKQLLSQLFASLLCVSYRSSFVFSPRWSPLAQSFSYCWLLTHSGALGVFSTNPPTFLTGMHTWFDYFPLKFM